LECGSLLPLLSSKFRVSSSQLKIAGLLGTQNWKLGTLKSGSKLPHSEMQGFCANLAAYAEDSSGTCTDALRSRPAV
jgi:hypothetical protein